MYIDNRVIILCVFQVGFEILLMRCSVVKYGEMK